MADSSLIWVVDDDPAIRELLSFMVTGAGYDVDAFSSGAEVLAHSGKPPNAVLLDLMMPGLSGMEVLEKIKAMDSKIQVILLTGHGATKDGIRGMQLGAFDYLIKPIDIDELIEKLNEAAKHMA